MSLELKWFIYVLIQHEIVTPEFALALLARLGQEDTTLEVYAQQLYNLLADGQPEDEQNRMLQQIQSYVEDAMDGADTGDEPPEIYELEIVDTAENEEGNAVPADDESSAPQVAPGGVFDPFAGKGAVPPPRPSEKRMEAEAEDESIEYATSTGELSRVRIETAEVATKDVRSDSEVGADSDSGPSVADIMSAFNRKHGGAHGQEKEDAPRTRTRNIARGPATETTRSMKKVKIESRLLNESAKSPGPGDTVPLSLPRFFTDTAKRTMKIDGLPRLDSVDKLNLGECALLMTDLVAVLRHNKISDLYVNAGEPLFVRRFGLISYLDTPKLSGKAAEHLNFALLDNDQKNEFGEKHRLSTSIALRDGRCRCNLRIQIHGISGSYHLAPPYIRNLSELGFLPAAEVSIHKLLDNPSGLIVVAGPAGSGKTTTLAAMVDYLVHKRAGQVVMLESPIEIIQENAKGNVIQREIGRHTGTMSMALRAAMREDPDVVVLSEIYNPSTIEQALRATEDGLLVIVSMYATSTAAVLARLMEVFEPLRRPEVRAMISGNLRGVVVQKLIDAAEGDSQTVIYELMTNTPETAAMLVDGRISAVTDLMRNSKRPDMCTLDGNVVAKYHAGHITGEVARKAIHHPDVRIKVEQEIALAEARKLISDWEKKK
ncbi:MAG: ATPase, T2SS/T4P/T4SS family [Victivallaceae bacterium]|nr:ATPase, T2SS/T4P/T4SS family [Victivallaceae bacterium]